MSQQMLIRVVEDWVKITGPQSLPRYDNSFGRIETNNFLDPVPYEVENRLALAYC